MKPDLRECTNCERLGACCWISVGIGTHSSGREIRVYSRVPCHKLDLQTGLCTDYKNRLDVPWCRQADDPQADRFPHFCPHTARLEGSRGAEGGGAPPLMMQAGRYFELAAKVDRTPAAREEFMRRIDQIAVKEIEQRFGVKLEPALGPDYKMRQRLRRAFARSAPRKTPRPSTSQDG